VPFGGSVPGGGWGGGVQVKNAYARHDCPLEQCVSSSRGISSLGGAEGGRSGRALVHAGRQPGGLNRHIATIFEIGKPADVTSLAENAEAVQVFVGTCERLVSD
jgi:hypothetical protein